MSFFADYYARINGEYSLCHDFEPNRHKNGRWLKLRLILIIVVLVC